MDPFKIICPSMADGCVASVAVNIFLVVVFLLVIVCTAFPRCKQTFCCFKQYDRLNEDAESGRGPNDTEVERPVTSDPTKRTEDNNGLNNTTNNSNTASTIDNDAGKDIGNEPKEDNELHHSNCSPLEPEGDEITKQVLRYESLEDEGIESSGVYDKDQEFTLSYDFTLESQPVKPGSAVNYNDLGTETKQSRDDNEVNQVTNIKQSTENEVKILNTNSEQSLEIEDKKFDNDSKQPSVNIIKQSSGDGDIVNKEADKKQDNTDDQKREDDGENLTEDVVTVDVQMYYDREGDFALKAAEKLVSSFNTKSNMKINYSVINDIKHIVPDKVLFILCVNSSRLGTDVQRAMSKLPDMRKAVLVIHPQEEYALPKLRSDKRLAADDIKLKTEFIFDFGYKRDIGFYECDWNSQCLIELEQYLYKFVSMYKKGYF